MYNVPTSLFTDLLHRLLIYVPTYFVSNLSAELLGDLSIDVFIQLYSQLFSYVSVKLHELGQD